MEKDNCILGSLINAALDIEAFVVCNLESMTQVKDIACCHKLGQEQYQQDCQVAAFATLLLWWSERCAAAEDREDHESYRRDSNNGQQVHFRQRLRHGIQEDVDGHAERCAGDDEDERVGDEQNELRGAFRAATHGYTHTHFTTSGLAIYACA